MENRKRNNRVTVHFSDDEINHLNEQVRKSGLNREQYIRELCKKSKIIEQPSIDYFKFITTGNRIGNNLNQLLVLANSGLEIDVVRVNETVETIHQFYEELRRKVFNINGNN